MPFSRIQFYSFFSPLMVPADKKDAKSQLSSWLHRIFCLYNDQIQPFPKMSQITDSTKKNFTQKFVSVNVTRVSKKFCNILVTCLLEALISPERSSSSREKSSFVVGNKVIVGALTRCALFHPACDLRTTQINVQRSLIWEFMLYDFEQGHNATEANKRICPARNKDTVDSKLPGFKIFFPFIPSRNRCGKQFIQRVNGVQPLK